MFKKTRNTSFVKCFYSFRATKGFQNTDVNVFSPQGQNTPRNLECFLEITQNTSVINDYMFLCVAENTNQEIQTGFQNSDFNVFFTFQTH